MKRFLAGFIAGVLLSAASVTFAANETIRLFVNGQEILFPEAPPQIINGRTMVPARPLAEALGAKVDWDENTRSVIITSEPSLEPEVSEVPLETEIDLSEWISLRQLAARGVYVDSGLTIRNNGVEITASAEELIQSGSTIGTVTKPDGSQTTIPIIVRNGQTWIRIADAKSIGLID